jgi:UDP-N-acetylmuramoyl-tripeptide--D-alanyl-D-alanine ligase
MTAILTWQAEDVIRAVQGQCLHEQNWHARGVAIDSRSVTPGDLFVALKGPTNDAHDYVADVFAKGAAAAIVMRQPAQIPTASPLIFVDDTFTALENLGAAGRARAEASILAVTGSVGKTGTKEMLRLMLSAVGDTYANQGSFNNHWGVPLSLARLPEEASYGVFELGMNHAGELGPLSKQVSPDVALITTIEAVHMEFFASVEMIADAKAEIFLGLKPDGTAVLNRDNPHFGRLRDAARKQGIKRIQSFGSEAKADARLIEYTGTPEGGIVAAEILGHKVKYLLGAQGPHLALNSLGALLAAIAGGGDMATCAEALAHYRPPQGRGVISTIHVAGGDITLVDESYNASPVAVRAAMKVLGQTTPGSGGRRIFVLGDMKELGAASASMHADLAADIAAAKIDKLYCCGEAVGHLYEALPRDVRGFHARDSVDLAPRVAAEIHAGDIVTVKGSHSMKMELVVEAIKALDPSSQEKMAS